jgi:uncharacterized iron-regulated membrane protein
MEFLKKLKNFFRPIHLYLGLLSGLVVFIISITGAIYCFEKPIRSFIYSELMLANNGDLPVHSLSEQLKAVVKNYPEKTVKILVVKRDKNFNTEIHFYQGGLAYINPCTLQIFEASHKKNDILAIALKMHKNLYLGKFGKLLIAISTLIFFLMLLSGLVLWWPFTKKLFLAKIKIIKSSNKFKRLYDLHTVLGFYAFWILIWMAITGVNWSFEIVNKAMRFALKPQIENTANQISFTYFDTSSAPLDNVFSLVKKRYPESNEQFIFLSAKESLPQRVFVNYNSSGFFNKQDKLFFNTKTGKAVKENNFTNSNAGYKYFASQKLIHTGEILGLFGQCLAFLGSLIGASLPVTGFLMWYEKRRIKAKK